MEKTASFSGEMGTRTSGGADGGSNPDPTGEREARDATRMVTLPRTFALRAVLLEGVPVSLDLA